MADVIRKATNRFTKGLIMDFSPENTKNEVLTNALNATLLTFNGNELSLQNDMGNARVETAYLPDGYIPVGTCEYGGIIYIVSYNPLEDKSLIGCFPSPERNISSDELGILNVKIERSHFQKFIGTGDDAYVDPSGEILQNTLYVLLKNDNLNPGDKFIVCANKDIYNERLQDLFIKRDENHYLGNVGTYEQITNPILALNIVSIEDSGKITYLNNDIKLYEIDNTYNIGSSEYTDTYKYHILGKILEGTNLVSLDDLDAYRNVLSSGYSVFKSKTSGKLAILAELIMIDSYSVTHSIVPQVDEYNKPIDGAFDIVIHSDITPELNKNNYKTAPKLSYYYLDNSLGYIQISTAERENIPIPLFNINKEDKTSEPNPSFFDTLLSSIYEPTQEDSDLKLDESLETTSNFNFPKPFTYHGHMEIIEDVEGNINSQTYTKFTEGKYHRIDYDQIRENLSYYTNVLRAKFYYYNSEGKAYEKYTQKEIIDTYTYYIPKANHIYTNINRDESYKDQPLYKLITEPMTATEEIIKDEAVVKYKYLKIHTYKVASKKDIESGIDLYEKKDELTYVLVIDEPEDGKTYYILVIEDALVEIGTFVDTLVITGTLYYFTEGKTYAEATTSDKEKYYDYGLYPNLPPFILYTREDKWDYIEATELDIQNYLEISTELYYSSDYILIKEIDKYRDPEKEYPLFIVVPVDSFVSYLYFKPDEDINWIEGYENANEKCPKDDPIHLYKVSNFIPQNTDKDPDNMSEEELKNYYNYLDLILAKILLPSTVYSNGLDLPFKYDYTLVPCMNYGKLNHLAVSNTVDFSKLHAFNLSDFNTWKYRIDDNQLRLTFGADVFDTYETNKVDGLFLEFYDCWGFAGSIEIVDKKSYSGIFTKIIPLNSLRALSTKKIKANGYSTTYKHNINIKKEKEQENVIYKYNGEQLNEPSYTDGWSDLSDLDNDCGTLYSNVVYGVKAYLRRTTSRGKEFIKKKEFFLYTLPIYNDFYYTINDFSTLSKPELNLMLTYKLLDSSTRIPYALDGITNGYNVTDSANVSSYLSGFYDKSSLDITKYYKYKGLTDLYLEIGLTKEYENLNISYDKDINNLFTCTLQLLSDDNSSTTFTINSGVEGLTDPKHILNYSTSDVTIETQVNNLSFVNGLNTDNGHILEISKDFALANFMNNIPINSKPFLILYEFVVGYTANVNDIRNTQVSATTVCALCHKKPNGEYNYEDFGVYEKDSKLLSNVMFYNEGTAEKEVFGICRQIYDGTDSNKTIVQLCNSITSVETDAQEIKTAGKLNSGDPLKQLVGNIGKLTFCLPHVHGLSEVNGVNIHEGPNGGLYGIPSDSGNWPNYGSSGDKEAGFGIAPRSYLFLHPKYNMCLNTKNSIVYNSEFISTLEYKTFTGKAWGINLAGSNEAHWIDNEMREYTGLTGADLVKFNTCMIETMKSVYAYNPDYDTLTVNIGNITLQKYNPYFTSNLISTDSKLSFNNGLTFNDYIYLSSIKFSDYLLQLKEFSKDAEGKSINIYKDNRTLLDQIQFIPNFDYCGSKTPYLISNLTYNTPVPSELEQELEFSSSDITVIKHSNGENTFLEGVPNKKVLYGYNQDFKKMILLDVSNYTIDSTGGLKVKNDGAKQNFEKVLEITEKELHLQLSDGTLQFTSTVDINDKKVDLSVRFNLSKRIPTIKAGDDGFFVGMEFNPNASGSFSLSPYMSVSTPTNLLDFTYSVKLNSIELECSYALLNDKASIQGGPLTLRSQDYLVLERLVDKSNTSYPIGDLNNKYYQISSVEYELTCSKIGNVNDNIGYIIDVNNQEDLTFEFNLNNAINPLESSYVVGLIEFRIKRINYTIILTSRLESTPETFLSTTKTSKYYNLESTYSVISDYKDACLRGSSITLNDLVYEPTPNGHRLFMRNNCCVYNSYLRGKLYYRVLNDLKPHESWNYKDTKYLNNLFIFTGPCYTTDNL